MRPFIRGPEEGRALPTPAGGQVRFTVSADESSGSISLFEFEVPAGAGPRLHVHEEREPFFESFAASVEPKEAAEPPSDGG